MSRVPEKTDFWTQRKAGVEAEEASERKSAAAEVHAREMERVEAQSDAEILEELGLPSPESLKKGDDFSSFMAKNVPERLRRRALRQLWGSNPVLANVDGLVDYGEDFTDASTVFEGMTTAYQVGKGMLKHVEELARQAEVALEEEPEEDSITSSEPEGVLETPHSNSESVETDVAEGNEPFEATPVAKPSRHRMKFTALRHESDCDLNAEGAGSI